jgi:hypothetical protein
MFDSGANQTTIGREKSASHHLKKQTRIITFAVQLSLGRETR